MEIEKRTTRDVHFLIETRDDDGTPKEVIRGHAAVFGVAADMGSFVEQIEPGFFADAIRSSDPRSLFNHNENYVLGRMSAGTLRVSEDGKGLLSETDPPATTWASDLMASMKRGDIKEMSFAFTLKSKDMGDDMDGDEWRKLPGGGWSRTLKANGCKELYDTSVVTYPAYNAANDVTVAQRSRQKWEAAHPETIPGPPAISEEEKAAAQRNAQASADAAARSRDLDLIEA